MAKYAKIYNKDTKEWEILNPIPMSDTPSGTTNASNVIVNNPYYADEDGNDVNLNDALTDISDSIYELRRNVSWLAEHKGTGGGGGGGVIVDTDYKIEVAGLKEDEKNVLDITDSTLEINFKINNAKKTKFEYIVYYDGKVVKSGNLVGTQTVYVKGKLSDNKNEHSLTITAVDEYGNDVPTYNTTIVERSISISISNKTISCPINGDAVIDIDVKNSIMGGKTSLVFSCDKNTSGKDYIHTYDNFYTGTHREKVYWRSILNEFGMLVKPGYTYNVSVYADDTLGGKSKPITFKMVMVSPDTLTVIISNGLSEEQDNSEDNTISYNSSLSFSFIAYKTNEERNPYYAVKIEHFNENTGVFEHAKAISGVYFGENDELNVEGKTYKNNNTTKYTVEQNITEKLTTDNYADYKGINRVTVKCWTNDGQYTSEVVGYFVLSLDNMVYLDFVNPVIGNGRRACLARWDKEDKSRPDNDKVTLWTSTKNDYYYFSDPTIETVSVGLQMHNVIGGPHNGYINNRLQFKSNAYGVVDLSEHTSEIRHWLGSGSAHQQCSGFTISLTFNAMDLPDTNKVVFFAGSNDSNGKLAKGIKITLDTITWKIGGEELVYRIRPTHLYTIDFVYDKVNGLAKLFVDGKISQGAEVQISDTILDAEVDTYKKLYLACDVVGGNISNKSSVYVYNLSLFSHSMPDDAVVINGKNARILDYSLESVKNDYIEWKNNNLFEISEDNKTVVSHLYNSSDGYLNPSFDELVKIAPVSVLEIEAVGDDNDFDFDFFTSVSGFIGEPIGNIRYRFRYIDRENNIISEDCVVENGCINIQGTSTTGYRSKNLEIYSDSTTAEHPKLWQVKEDWFPEFEYTLKADVMDSSHANNAVIGKWINDNSEALGMEKNPAQMAMDYQVNGEYVNRPVKTDYSGEPVVENGATIRHTQPKVKHTIEGFPVIVLAKFARDIKDGQQVTRFLGIYSFNLGRYSHYNLGLKFLKSYSTEDNSGKEFSAPCVVSSYEEQPIVTSAPVDGDNYTRIYYSTDNYFHLNEVFSYEFNEAGDMNDVKHPSWSQSDMSIIKHIGDFNFNGTTESGTDTAPESAWVSLKKLFDVTDALCYWNYNIKGKYVWNNTSYIPSGEKQIPSDNNTALCERLSSHLSFNNTSVYFTVCVALGLTDSLGKNFTLRTWGSDMWFPTFYDLDTALGLNNSGGENILSTEYIDEFYNRGKYCYIIDNVEYYTNDLKDIPEGVDYLLAPNLYQTIFNSNKSKYSSFNSKLWDIFRNDSLKSDLINANASYKTYDEVWINLRKYDKNENNNKLLDNASRFVSLIENQMKYCGELLFNADYYFKYISKYKKPGSDVATFGDIGMLHGDRVEYVRKWLNERLNFFDGIFMQNFKLETSAYSSSFLRSTSLGAYGKQNGNCAFTITTNLPIFFTVAMQNNNTGEIIGATHMYYVPKNTPTEIVMFNFSGNNGRQFLINARDAITNIAGLQDIRFSHIIGEPIPKLSVIDIENIDSLKTNAFNFAQHFVFKDEETNMLVSNINTLKFKGAKKEKNEDGSKFNFNVVLSGTTFAYDKVDYIDISNSDVTNLELPAVPISTLIVNNSKIPSLNLTNQPIIKELNLAGCNSLTTLTIENCNNLSELNLSNLKSLATVNISNCSKLKSIICNENSNLITLTIKDCENLENIDLSKCDNESLSILMGGDMSSLSAVDLSYTKTSSIQFPKPEFLKHVTYLNLSYNNKIVYFKFEDVEYNENLLDLTPFVSLNKNENGLYLLNNTNVKFIKCGTENNYFNTYTKQFSDMAKLERVYGYLNIKGNTVFEGSVNFKLNDDYTIIGEKDVATQEFTITPKTLHVNDLCTVIKFDETLTNASHMFDTTKCSPYDMLYVLKFVDNITDLSYMFRECYNSGNDEHFDYRYAFSHCGNVVNLNGFMHTKNQTDTKVYLYSSYIDEYGVNRYNGTFSFLGNLESFNGSFNGHYVIFDNTNTHTQTWLFDDKELPNNRELKIKNIGEFKIDEFAYDFIMKSSTLFKNLPMLTSLTDSFNETNISFNFADGYNAYGVKNDDYKGCELFYNNTNLENVENCFNKLTTYYAVGFQEFNNIFGGDLPETIDDYTHYPRKLKVFRDNFKFYPNTDGTRIKMLITDNTLSTLTELVNISSSFIGEGIQKYSIGDYPYNILHNNKKIENIAYFLSELEIINKKNNTIILPGTLFVDEYGVPRSNTLNNVDGCFYDVKFNFELEPNRFNGTNITSVAYLCGKKQTIYNNTVGLYSMIPSDLFRNTDNNGNIKKIITNMSYAFSGINNLVPCFGCKYDVNDMDTVENALKNGYLVENTNKESGHSKYVWNIFKSDGNGNNYRNAILNSGAYKSADVPKDGDIDFDECLSENYYDMSNILENSGYEYTETNGFMCPPDLFYYCNTLNGKGLNITYIFNYSNGIKGTIPPMIFECISDIENLSGVFSGPEIHPFKNVTKNKAGVIYPPRLLKKLTNLTNISDLFANTYIAPNTHVSDETFRYNQKLNNLSGLWKETVWLKTSIIYDFDDYLKPLPVNLFSENTSVNNITSMFEKSNMNIIINNLFNKNKNTNLVLTTNYMFMVVNLLNGGSADKFWEFVNTNDYMNNGTYAIGYNATPNNNEIKNSLGFNDDEIDNHNIYFKYF